MSCSAIDSLAHSDRYAGTIGVSKHAAKELGDVMYVELPPIDEDVEAGSTVGAVESVKSANDIITPVSGKVVEVNERLSEKSGIVNESPEEDGWMAKIEVSNAAEVDALMDEEQYRKFLEEVQPDH